MGDPSQIVVGVARAAATGLQLLGTSVVVSQNHLVTALHVVGADPSNLVAFMPRTQTVNEYQDTTDLRANSVALSVAAVDTFRDLCLLRLPDNAVASPGYTIGSADDAPTGMGVVTYGYPHANHGRYVLTAQTSTVGARVLIANGPLKSKHLVLNIQTRPGQSGSPVFLVNTPQLVGLVIGSYAPDGGGGIMLGDVDPATLHQTTHAISAEYVRAMLA